jgi:mediator of RNA polymerase II transcription subunit 4
MPITSNPASSAGHGGTTAATIAKNASTATTVKDKLLSVLDDIELISKELFELLLLPKHARAASSVTHQSSLLSTSWEHSQVAELLVAKDRELKALLMEAKDQEEVHRKTESLKTEVDRQDEEIRQLQKHLKEAEHVLATSIFQAKQKLSLMNKGNLSSEEIIRYAHRISASHAVAAPYNWEVGDPRRPYPTDIEMRAGWLGQVTQDPSALSAPSLVPPMTGPPPPTTSLPGPSTSGVHMGGPPLPYSWQQQQTPGGPSTPSDVKPNLSQLPPLPPGGDVGRGKTDSLEDVEVMSTDSSSSSSSDSQ